MKPVTNRERNTLIGAFIAFLVVGFTLREVYKQPKEVAQTPAKNAQTEEYAPYIEPQNVKQEPYTISKIEAAIFVTEPIHLENGKVIDLTEEDYKCLAEIPGSRNVVRVYRYVSYKNYQCLETDLTKREFSKFVDTVNRKREGFRLANPDK